MVQTPPDLEMVKGRQQKMWASGDFSAVATPLVIVGELLVEEVDPSAGQRVLDVACGSGTATLAAARRNCEVVGIDYVPALLERGRERAAAERLNIDFQEGDAENLKFPDASFDIVLSTFGVMFAPNQAKAASELLRVCKPGGKIGLANWTPEGGVGEMFRTTAKHVPPPPGVTSPLRWGTEPGLRELFGEGISDLKIEHQMFRMRYPTPKAFVDYFRDNFGPTLTAFGALDDAGKAAYESDLIAMLNRQNEKTDGTLKTSSEYLQVVATRT